MVCGNWRLYPFNDQWAVEPAEGSASRRRSRRTYSPQLGGAMQTLLDRITLEKGLDVRDFQKARSEILGLISAIVSAAKEAGLVP